MLAAILIPLLFTAVNEELFEFIKMLAVYVLAITVTSAYLIIRIGQKRWQWQKTPLDIVVILFLIAQLLSTIFSIHPATSFFGYYTRFHGGLLSTMAYVAIFYVLFNYLHDLPYQKALQSIRYLLTSILIGAVLVGLYAIPEHFGHSASCLIVQGSFDVTCWVQDVQNRVFATIGQPNWLAAYMIMVLPLAIVGLLTSQVRRIANTPHPTTNPRYPVPTQSGSGSSNVRVSNKVQDNKRTLNFSIHRILSMVGWLSLIIIYYLTLIFTKSRSGWLGLVVGMVVFSIGWLFAKWQFRKNQSVVNQVQEANQGSSSKQLLGSSMIFTSLIGILIVLSVIYGTPFTPPLFSHNRPTTTTIVTPTGTSLDSGGTESGEIRKIVWQGALKVWQHYPIFGSGLETFAYSYYQDRLMTHNLVSEWNFLYNKAHNEFLNYLATTGLVGLLTYVLLLGWGCWLGVNLLWQRVKDLSQFSSHSELVKDLAGAMDPESSNFGLTQYSELTNQINLNEGSNYSFILSPLLPLALVSGIIALSVSNFFGFSTVMVTLLMYIFLAIVSVLTILDSQRVTSRLLDQKDLNNKFLSKNQRRRLKKEMARQMTYTSQPASFSSWWQYALTSLICIITIILIWNTLNWWMADVAFAKGKTLIRGSQWQDGLATLIAASERSPKEALYTDTLSEQYAQLALKLVELNEATLSAEFIQAAQQASDVTLKLNPVHLNFWKTRVRLYSQLAALDPQYLTQTKAALEAAIKLAPTDPALVFNRGKIAVFEQNWPEAEQSYLEAIDMKPNFVEARMSLAELYEQLNRPSDASQQYQYLLDHINPDDELLQNKVAELATASGQRR